jgi:hypothetical protein
MLLLMMPLIALIAITSHTDFYVLPAAAPAALVAGQTNQLPNGIELRGGTAVIRAEAPVTYNLLAAASEHNKRGTRGARGLKQVMTIQRRNGELKAEIDVADLWNALCNAGGLHLVSA